MGFPRQEYWSRLPFPPPGDLPDPGIEPAPVSLRIKGESPWPGGSNEASEFGTGRSVPSRGPAGWSLGNAKALRVGVGSGQGCPDVQLNRLWDGASSVGALPSIRGVSGQGQGWELERPLKLTP